MRHHMYGQMSLTPVRTAMPLNQVDWAGSDGNFAESVQGCGLRQLIYMKTELNAYGMDQTSPIRFTTGYPKATVFLEWVTWVQV